MTQTTAFLLTIAVEAPIVLALAAFRRWPPNDLVRLLGVALGANAATHPLLWLADDALVASTSWGARVAALEALVVLIEGFAYAVPAGLSARRGFVASLVANAASTAVGLAIYSLS